MRITLGLDDDLLDKAQKHAAERGTTLTVMLEQALREILARQEKEPQIESQPLPTFMGQGLRSGVDLDDSAALRDLMDGF